MGDPGGSGDQAVPVETVETVEELDLAHRRWRALYDQVVADYLSLGPAAAKAGTLPPAIPAATSLAHMQAATTELDGLATSIRMVRVELQAQASQRALTAAMDILR